MTAFRVNWFDYKPGKIIKKKTVVFFFMRFLLKRIERIFKGQMTISQQ